MSNIFVTSDLHVGHSNIIKHCQRPFVSVDEMDAALIANWNGRVAKDDIVLVLGDFSFRATRNVRDYVRQLNGKIMFQFGNHDNRPESHNAGFHTILDNAIWEYRIPEGMDGKHDRIIISHYPLLGWNGAFHGRVHLFGHVHSGPYKPYTGQCNSYDVGVDNNEFAPILLEDAIKKARLNTRILGCW